MIGIGECIHIISQDVRNAVENRDKAFIQDLAKRQVDKGAAYLDLNIGPQKKAGAEVMPWIVETVQEVTDVPLSLDTTNAVAMEAGLKVCKKKALINSTSADPERLKLAMPLAAKYNADIIALTLRATGLPVTADARVEILMDDLLTAAEEYGVPQENLFIDPLVLTVNGTQEHAPELPKAILLIKGMTDPPLKTTCGLSNISSGAPAGLRPLLNRVFMVILLGAGLDSAIMDPLDDKLMETLRIVDKKDDSTPLGKLYSDLYDAHAEGEQLDTSTIDTSDPEIRDVVKTIDVLQGKTLYAHGYLGT